MGSEKKASGTVVNMGRDQYIFDRSWEGIIAFKQTNAEVSIYNHWSIMKRILTGLEGDMFILL